MLNKHSTTVSLGRNRYQTTIGLKPINYQDGSIWKHIINNWTDSGIGDKPHMVVTAPFMVGVNPNGGRRIHPTREQDVWFEISGAKINQSGSWNVVQLGTPTSRVNNRITWNRTNFNAYMDMGGHFIKLGYLLKGGFLPPNNQFAFEVATQGLTRSGCVFSKDGIPVMHLRNPIAYDHDNPTDIRQIAHEVTRIDGKWHAVFSLPSLAGMSKPVIDPTLTLQPDSAAGKDTWTQSTDPDSTMGTHALLRVSSVNFIGLIEFDVSGISGETVSSSSLSLWTAAALTRGCRGYPILVANNGWIELCTWNYADGAGASDRWAGDVGNDGGADAGCGQSGVDYNATYIGQWLMSGVDNDKVSSALTVSDIQDWVDGNNYGLALVNYTGGPLSDWHSSDSLTAAYRPELVINHSSAGGNKDTTPQFFPILFDKKKH